MHSGYDLWLYPELFIEKLTIPLRISYFCVVITNFMDKITEEQKKTARFAKAMAHPVRIYILQLLSNQSCCYSGDLSDVLPIAKSTLSQHLKELKAAGLIQGEIEPPRIKYCLNKENWATAQKLLRKMLQL